MILQRTLPGEIFKAQRTLKLRMDAALVLQMPLQVLFPKTASVRPTTHVRAQRHLNRGAFSWNAKGVGETKTNTRFNDLQCDTFRTVVIAVQRVKINKKGSPGLYTIRTPQGTAPVLCPARERADFGLAD